MKRRNLLGLLLLFAVGCGAATQTASDSEQATLPRPEVIRLAITDVQGIEQLESDYGDFRDTLEETLDVEVEFFAVEDHLGAASALQAGQVDLVLAGPSEYVVINARTNASPVVALTRPNYRSVLAVRADSDIQSIADLKGKTIAVSNLGSTASHLGTTQILLNAGLTPDAVTLAVLDDPSHGQKGLAALQSGEVDAWGVVIYRYEDYLAEKGLTEADFPALEIGELLPNDVFVASSLLDPAFVEDMRNRMVENQEQLMTGIVAAESKFEGGELVPTDDAAYDMIREVYKALGQDDVIK